MDRVIKDIKNNFKLNDIYTSVHGSEKLINDLDYDFGDYGVNMSLGSMADMRISWVRMLLDEKWLLYYEHCHQHGEISSSHLKIYDVSDVESVWDLGGREDKDEANNNSEIVFTHSMFGSMLNMFNKNIQKPNALRKREYLDRVCSEYSIELDDMLRVLSILCAFPFGQAVTILLDEDSDSGVYTSQIVKLDDLLDYVYSPGEETKHESNIDTNQLEMLMLMLASLKQNVNTEESDSDESN